MTDISELLSSRAPRYTSYPTAPHFHGGIDGTVFAEWLRELPQAMPLSLYFHIPFCDSLCWFCGCHTAVVNNYRPVARYVEALIAEMQNVASVLGPDRTVSHIHWGGGSPTILSPGDIARLDAQTRRLFAVAPDAEFAVEIDPRGFSEATARALAASGVNRASLGLQDSNPIVQAAINRLQTDEETRNAVQLLRKVGINRINLDLIYGLPHQDRDGIARTIGLALSLAPDRLAVFGYAHVPGFKKHQALISEAALPGPQERLEQELCIHAMLTAAGYDAVGLDHYARHDDRLSQAATNGSLRRNFQGYTTDAAPALIGFGASAISSLPQGHAQNTVSTATWRERIESGKLATAKGIALTAEDHVRRRVIEALMCDLSVDLADIRQYFALSPGSFAAELQKLAPLVDARLVTIGQERVAITGPYRQVARLAAAAFDTRLDQAPTHHAMTA